MTRLKITCFHVSDLNLLSPLLHELQELELEFPTELALSDDDAKSQMKELAPFLRALQVRRFCTCLCSFSFVIF